jgi:prolycopene isomerase
MPASPRESAYDVVVIGSGIGGLSAGAALARSGRSVLVAEQGAGHGGYAHSFKRGPYTFDPGISVFPQGHDDALPMAMLDWLGVRERCRMIALESNYRAVFPGYELVTPFDFDEFIELHRREFPAEAKSIDEFFHLCRQMHKEAHELPPQVGLAGLDEAAKRFPVLFRWIRATVGEVLDECFSDPLLKAVASCAWPYVGLPPSRLSYLTFSTVLSVYLEGCFYPEGGFQSLADALLAGMERSGGELVLGRRATRIVIEDGQAKGVELDGTEVVRCRAVVSNADATATFEQLIGADLLPPAFIKRLRRMKPSLSAVIVFLATTLDLDTHGGVHEVFRPLHVDHDQTLDDIFAGKPGGMFGTVPTIADPGLAPAGEHLLIVHSLAPYDVGRPWPELVEGYTQQVLDAYEAPFPGLRDAITFKETATPLALERHCLNRAGAAYGWENTPAQTGGKRSPHQAPVSNIFLSGHWTQPGTGSLRALVSGLHTAQMVLRSMDSGPLSFEHPDFPPA